MIRLPLPLSSTLVALTGLLVAAPDAGADVLDIVADHDSALYFNSTGALANGAGDFIFAGTTAGGEPRRSLLRFDVTAIPAGSTINSVTLSLEMNMTISGDQVVDLHRAIVPWGEGASDPGGQEGGGTAAVAGDATWIHTFSGGCIWSTAGGDFAPSASGSGTVGLVPGPYTFTGAGLAADVQAWIDGTLPNHGWLLKHTDEVNAASAKRFASRQHPTMSVHPRITVDFTTGPGCGATNYCGPGNVNSTGCPASIGWAGSCTISDANFTLTADGLPSGQFGYFLGSTAKGLLMPANSDGFICLSGNIGRFNQPGRIIVGPSGSVTIDLGAIPTSPPVGVLPGDTWNFQCWHRDVGNTNNFTNALQVTFD
ncbi:MAG: DNRLRE domain-containing protein [bacterium]|nr:DNRLRE domain-containing protein [bacterium]